MNNNNNNNNTNDNTKNNNNKEDFYSTHLPHTVGAQIFSFFFFFIFFHFLFYFIFFSNINKTNIGVTSYASGWRKDAVSQYLEFAPCS